MNIYCKTIKPQKTKSARIISVILVTLGAILAELMLVAMWFFLNHNYYPVEGTSMYPTISDRNTAVYIKMGEPYTYGDIVVAYNNADVRIVKRVIALGGDKFGFYHNEETGVFEPVIIYKDASEAVKIDEPYIVNPENNAVAKEFLYNQNLMVKTFEEHSYNGQTVKFIVVDENSVFLMGDNRRVSLDSSTYGPIKANLVMGKLALVVSSTGWHLDQVLLYCFGLRGTL